MTYVFFAAAQLFCDHILLGNCSSVHLAFVADFMPCTSLCYCPSWSCQPHKSGLTGVVPQVVGMGHHHSFLEEAHPQFFAPRGFNLTSIFIMQAPWGENTFTSLHKALFNNGLKGRRMGPPLLFDHSWHAPIKCAIHPCSLSLSHYGGNLGWVLMHGVPRKAGEIDLMDLYDSCTHWLRWPFSLHFLCLPALCFCEGPRGGEAYKRNKSLISNELQATNRERTHWKCTSKIEWANLFSLYRFVFLLCIPKM